ncbi:MAG: flagellar export chaperone FlgN [Eubacterium sp.]|nr:flagellar export chaperone FlgN [Eubacterium sp.]
MSASSDSRTYVSMMLDSLKKKKEILSILYEQTREQERILSADEVDADRFEEVLEEKGKEIDELNLVDDGFDSLFKKLEQELMGNQESYKEEISRMKVLITEVTDLGTKIQVLEKKNHDRFQQYIASEREKLKAANKSQQMAMTYARNMTDRHKPGDSYFVNEKK